MVQKFIERPVLSTVISIVIVIMGILGVLTLPITQYPDIAPPMVSVEANYQGASADVVLKSVVTPLEEAINGVEGMDYITSSASNDGSARIKVFFKLGQDPDMAAVNVQNCVAKATSRLPKEVVETGVTTKKTQNSSVLALSVYSTNPEHDETFIQNYVRINIYPILQRVNGVGQISVFGLKEYSMRVWLKPEKMAAYNLMPSDVVRAIKEQSLEAAPGKFGQQSNQAFEYVIKYKGRLTEVDQYENIVIRSEQDGEMLRLKDVARLEFGAFDYSMTSTGNGNPAVMMMIYQTTDSNAKTLVDNLKSEVAKASENFPPGMSYSTPLDNNEFLNASIHSVIQTLIEAFILVFIVVYVFLQDLRSTLIPTISALVAIIGTFFFLELFGFSINILTLFALVLAIGIVVDDAIVVVEAVHAKMQNEKLHPREATKTAMGEITGAIVSITIVITAVFAPVAFMGGSAGVFYRQFAVTLAVAVLISAVNALTLSPALCAILIKPHKEHAPGEKLNYIERFQKAFESGYETLNRKYIGGLTVLLKRKWIVVVSLIVCTILTIFLAKITPTGFIPNEDKGSIMADITLPEGATLERTKEITHAIDSICASMPIIVERTVVSGASLLSSGFGGSYGMMIIKLKPWAERSPTSLKETIGELYARTAHLKDARIIFFTPPSVSGFGISAGFELQLQDRTGGSIENMSQVAQDFITDLTKRPEINYAITNFQINFPQYQLDVDVDKCKLAGVQLSDVFTTLQAYYGGMFVNDFNKFTKLYRVMVQSEPDSRKDLESIERVMIRNDQGQMVPINTLVTFTRVFGPQGINRFNLFNAVTINGQTQEGYSTGEAMTAVAEVAKTSLPSGFSFEYSGMARQEMGSGNESLFIFLLCFIFVYLILCAQYESYILPLAVMTSLIVGIFGVFISILLMKLENNIYVQVALIMLIGLLAKNAILIVEFARQKRHEGASIYDAAKEAARLRLRPILMTSFAFVFGLFPLIISTGAGAVGNRSIGTGAAGGFLIATILGVFIIPVLFIIFQTLDEKLAKKIKQ